MEIEQLDRWMEQLQDTSARHTTELAEIMTVLMGPAPNRDNGLRGDVKNLQKELELDMIWARDIWNVKRREECLGLVDTSKLWMEVTKMEAMLQKMAETKSNLKGIYVTSALQFLGLVVVALISAGVFK